MVVAIVKSLFACAKVLVNCAVAGAGGGVRVMVALGAGFSTQ